MCKIKRGYPHILLLFLLSYLLMSANIGGVPVYILDEARNASCAREMMERGDMIVPTFNGELRTDKPPLHYYFMMTGFRFFGVNAFGARFFSVLFGCFTVIITWLFARRYGGLRIAWISAGILLSSFHFVLQFHLAVPDPYLIFFIAASFFCFFIFWKEGKPRYIYLFYVCLGLGTLAKGPVAVVIPGLVVFFFLLFIRDFSLRRLWSLKPLQGMLIFSFVALPWYILVHIQTAGAWTEGFFLTHNVNRFTSTMEGHGGFFVIPFLYFAVGMLPFTVFSWQAFKGAWEQRRQPLPVFLLLICLVVVIFFAFSRTQLPNYIVPMYPAFAVLCAIFIDKLISGEVSRRSIRISLIVYFAVTFLLPVAVFVALRYEAQLAHLSYLWVCFALLPVSGVAALFYFNRKQIKHLLLLITAAWLITGSLFYHVAFPAINHQNPIEQAKLLVCSDAEFAYFRRMNPAFVFYLQRHIPVLESAEDIAAFFSHYPDGYLITVKRQYLKYEEMLRGQGLSVLLEQKDLFENPTSMILVRSSE